jgi:hypothetical protein
MTQLKAVLFVVAVVLVVDYTLFRQPSLTCYLPQQTIQQTARTVTTPSSTSQETTVPNENNENEAPANTFLPPIITTKTTTTTTTPPLNINKTEYTWIGSQWIPPPGIPRYTPHEMRAFFARHNTLFIGDSTLRRAYATLFALVNTSNLNDIPTRSIDRPSIIDVNKYTYNTTREVCHSYMDFDTRNTARSRQWSNDTFLCRHVRDPTTPSRNDNNKKWGKLDYGGAACYKDLNQFINTDLVYSQKTSKEYSLVVFGLGIWETSRGIACQASDRDKGGPMAHLQSALEWVAMLPTSNLTVVWRTTGFHQMGIGDNYNYQINDLSIRLIDKAVADSKRNHFPTSPKTKKQRPVSGSSRNRTAPHDELNLTFVDWASVIVKRSYGIDRIHGDMGAHYGLEARLLFLQMLMHELVSREQQQ